MPKKFIFYCTGFIFLSVIMFLHSGCSKNRAKDQLSNPAYNSEINAFTSGIIPAGSVIQVKLTSDYTGKIKPGETFDFKLFEIKPSLEGKAILSDKNTVEFRPENSMPSGQDYKVKLRVSKLFPDKKGVQDFEFGFSTIPLSFMIDFYGLRAENSVELTWNQITGKITTSDKLDERKFENILQATQNGRALKVIWSHDPNGTVHEFSIDSVRRSEKREIVELIWDGRETSKVFRGTKQYDIPALSEFTLLETRVFQQPEQYIQLVFSDPIKSDQYLNGLVNLSNFTGLRFTVENNIIKVYPEVRQSGTLDLSISPGIKNISGYSYPATNNISINFEELSPSLRLIGHGVIMPGSDGLIFPFEAVNLKAIEVKVIRIYESNVSQFLQVNDLDGEDELKRAGRLIVKKTISLTSTRPINYGEWNAFAIDLSNLIKTEPGSIYRVELSFQKKHSLYHCGDSDGNESGNLVYTADEQNDISASDMSYWDSQYGYYDYDYYDYDWEERDNPCSDSYYNGSRKVSRNMLASNLGIIAKRGNDNSMLIAVTDLLTTASIGGVDLEIYNFQQQLISSASTDNEGFAEIKIEGQPFLLIAKKDKQRGYLKLFDGSSLSLSQFNISGNAVTKGVKGFIYGERGVWRPGDTLFLNFILEDKEKILPDNHPVRFELFDPQGKNIEKRVLTEGLNGFYCIKVATGQEAPTGNWRLEVSVGGLTFSSAVRVETVKPNRLKIKLEFPDSELHSDNLKNRARIKVSWLHGSPASNLETRVSVNFSVMETLFPGYEDYWFVDPSKNFYPTEKEIFNSSLDENGEASFVPEFYVTGTSPGKLRATFTSRSFEKGGDFSIDQYSIPYSPYKNYIGVKSPEGNSYGMLVTDTLQNFFVVSLNEQGNPVDLNGLEVNVYKLNWRWWWYSSGENLASYTGSTFQEPVFHKIISTKAGKAQFSFKISYPDWGRFLVKVSDPEGLHSSGKIIYFDWPGWVSRSSRENPEAASILVLSSDKEKYSVGETAKITIPTSKAGRILVSIENGTKVINHSWINSDRKDAVYSFPVTADMAPNVYVNVSLIQPHGQSNNDLPIRMYGVIPVFVEDRESHLEPQISMPDVLRPESEVVIKISEKSRKPMTYTLAIVDEGLLDLTRFKTPDPWKSFYSKQALGVKSFDIYDWVIGAYGGRIDGVFSIGGGEEGDNANAQAKANRFPPMVKFIGPFNLEKGNTNTHKVSIPNYVGSVKIMVVAGKQGSFGNAEKVCAVRKPLMILTTLPRVASPGEYLSVPVTVFAMEGQVKKVMLNLEANNLFETEETEKVIEFSGIGDITVDFKVKVKSETGTAKVKVRAVSGKEEASTETQMEIRSPNPEITVQYYGVINANETWDKSFELPGIAGSNKAELEVSSLPPVDFGKRLKYLLTYPYGCMEQVTSSVFPQLFLSDVMDLDQNAKEFAERNIKAGIEKLQNFQLSSGGLGLWPNSTSENDWGTSYAGHFMIEAEKKGYVVSRDWIKKWTNYQKKVARTWTGKKYENQWEQKSLELCQSYRLYTLALAGEPDLGAMNRLREKKDLDISASWQLLAAYILAGQQQTALDIYNTLTTEIPVYNDTYYTYGSELRDKGFILQSMNLLGKKEEALPVLKYISDKLSGEGWYSTQTTAVCLMAVSKFAGAGATSKNLSYDYSINKGEKKRAATNSSYSQIPVTFGKSQSGQVSVTNAGKGIAFVRLSLHGIPLAGNEKNISQNLKLQVSYKDLNGRLLDISRLDQGKDFIAEVSVFNPGTLGNYQNLALTQILASGWEIQNQRLFESKLGNYSLPEYMDIRDDRVYYYFSLARNQSKVFAIKLNAAYKGRYYLPGTICEEMYRGDARAMESGRWVEVK